MGRPVKRLADLIDPGDDTHPPDDANDVPADAELQELTNVSERQTDLIL